MMLKECVWETNFSVRAAMSRGHPVGDNVEAWTAASCDDVDIPFGLVFFFPLYWNRS